MSAIVVSTAPTPNACTTFVGERHLRSKCPDLCKDVAPVNSTKLYLCGDARLGPKLLPRVFPLDDITHPYNRFGGLCPAAFLKEWIDPNTGWYRYPPKGGFQLDTNDQPIQGNITLAAGTLLDRFGSEYGNFLAPAGSSYPQRALPPSNLDTPQDRDKNNYPNNYHVYRVLKAFNVLSGPIAPWFGQAGQGVQYLTLSNILTLINEKFLERVPLNRGATSY
ncbi:hypothetical protein BGZ70_007820 [Mortierella alpina]|uniref:TNT domain-containing protein n=1 Tax=Mortierella alpina TaxID=64518 RepID=A0A9P6J856_MORAP|nr:hypothetical protein BGZ70_007820 [Mortierella alpina]